MREKDLKKVLKSLNKINLSEYPNIKIGLIIPLESYIKVNSLLLFFQIIRNLFFRYLIMDVNGDLRSKTIFFSSTVSEREDYEFMYNKTKKYVNNAGEVIIFKSLRKCDIYRDKINKLVSAIQLIKYIIDHIDIKFGKLANFIKFSNNIKHIGNPMLVAYCASYLVAYLPIYKSLNTGVFNNSDRLIVFGDCFPLDNLAVQVFKNISRFNKTATMTHGYMYLTNKGYNNWNFIKCISDEVLVWNKFVYKEFLEAGFERNKLVILGCPKYLGEGNVNIPKVFVSKRCFGILLDVPTYDFKRKYNITMIKFANKFALKHNLKYMIKIHPLDDVYYYEKLVDQRVFIKFAPKDMSVNYFCNSVDFLLAHASSSYVEALYWYKPVFRYSSPFSDKIPFSKYLDFKTARELTNSYLFLLINFDCAIKEVIKLRDKYIGNYDIETKYEKYMCNVTEQTKV